MIELLWKRPDGTFVANVNGMPYHVVPGDEPLWSQAVARNVEIGKWLEFEPPPPPVYIEPLTKLSKATLWRRCSDDEAEALAFALSQAPFRLRLIFEAAQYLDTADDDYPALRAGIVAAVGRTRADELLEPEI